jgi:peptidoglycan/LPS O-acetylase OafA/YrhL
VTTFAPTANEQEIRAFDHVPALDGFRGLAVFVVVVFHIPVMTPSVGQKFSGGFLGVDIFFVLSGFLITAILLREQVLVGRIRFLQFFFKRAVRLLPALFVFGVAFSIYASIAGFDRGATRSNLLAIAFYYYNWKGVHDFFGLVEGLGHLWSLSVEEQFYLVWPFVIAGLGLMFGRRPRLAMSLIAVGVIGIALQRLRLLEAGDPTIFLYVRTDTRADGLLVGAIVAYVWTHRLVPVGRWLRVVGPIAGAGVVVCLFVSEVGASWLYRGGFTGIAVAIGIAILYVVEVPSSMVERVLGLPILRVLGRVSYATYVWHLPVFYAMNRYMADVPALGRVGAGLAITAIAVTLSWVFVERPALALKDRVLLQRRSVQ